MAVCSSLCPLDHTAQDHTFLDYTDLDYTVLDQAAQDHTVVDHTAQDQTALDHRDQNHTVLDCYWTSMDQLCQLSLAFQTHRKFHPLLVLDPRQCCVFLALFSLAVFGVV